jgi:hypothetical protein
MQKMRWRSLASRRDDRYVFETQRERSGQPQRYHFSIYTEYCCGWPLLSLKFTPQISVIPISDKTAACGGLEVEKICSDLQKKLDL